MPLFGIDDASRLFDSENMRIQGKSMSFSSRFMLILLLCLFASTPSSLHAQQAPFLPVEGAALAQRPFSDGSQPKIGRAHV